MAKIVPGGEKHSINAGSTPYHGASGRPDGRLPGGVAHGGARKREKETGEGNG
jgi:hypothetical protein